MKLFKSRSNVPKTSIADDEKAAPLVGQSQSIKPSSKPGGSSARTDSNFSNQSTYSQGSATARSVSTNSNPNQPEQSKKDKVKAKINDTFNYNKYTLKHQIMIFTSLSLCVVWIALILAIVWLLSGVYETSKNELIKEIKRVEYDNIEALGSQLLFSY